jgi:hypothetical protein
MAYFDPAFPIIPPLDPSGRGEASGYPWADAGMSLRDYFAARAMHALLITDTVPGPACDALLEAAAKAGREPLDHLALNAYQCADAMLRARKGDPS